MNITQDKIKIFLLFSLFSLALLVSQHFIDNLIFNNAPKSVALNNGLDKTLERERLFQSFLADSTTQLSSIRQNSSLQQFFDNQTRQPLEELFEFVAKNNPYIMQVRLLDATGQEVIRVERSQYKSIPLSVAPDNLQNKANSPYFKDATNQTFEQVLFSKLDLNLENGQIEMPFKPTLRAYLPVFNKQQLQGVLVINYFIEPFLKQLIDAPLYDVILADSDGNYLYHFDKSKSWSAFRGIEKALNQDFKEVDLFTQKTVYLNENYITRQLNLPFKTPLYLILQLKQPYFEALATESRKQTLIVAFITLLMAILASLVMARQLDKLWRNLNTARALEKQFRDTFEQAASGIAHIDIDGQWLRINKTLFKILGYTQAQLDNITLNELRHPDERQNAQKLKHKLLSGDIEHYQIENRLKHQQGHYVWVGITISLVRNDQQNPQYFILVIHDISHEKKLYDDLNLANETLKIAQQTAHLGFWELDHKTQQLSWNAQTYEIFGLKPYGIEPTFMNFLSFIPEAEHKELLTVFNASIKNKHNYNFSHSVVTQTHKTLYVQERGHHIFDAQGEVLKTIGTVQDQTEQVKAYQRIQKIFDLQSQLLFLTDGLKITLANQALLAFYGKLTLASFKHNGQNLLARLIPSSNETKHLKLTEWLKLQTQTTAAIPAITLKNPQGKVHTFSLSVHEFDENQWLITLLDITKTVLEKALLENKVNQDALTKAHTRHFFETHIDHLIEQAYTNQKSLGIIYFDIDFFKQVNDTYGHDMGDEVLKTIVIICKANLREKDYVIRWGGEEFLILIQVDSEKVLRQVTENIRRKIANHEFDTQTQITASFGITLHQPGSSIKYTLSQADEALYKAKNNGRNQIFIAPSAS